MLRTSIRAPVFYVFGDLLEPWTVKPTIPKFLKKIRGRNLLSFLFKVCIKKLIFYVFGRQLPFPGPRPTPPKHKIISFMLTFVCFWQSGHTNLKFCTDFYKFLVICWSHGSGRRNSRNFGKKDNVDVHRTQGTL